MRATRGSRSSAPSRTRSHFEPTTALVGVATQGGRFPPAWRELLKASIEAGLDLESGLHEFVSDDPELVELAAKHGVELRDLRKPPADLSVPTGENLRLAAKTVLTVGSDCAIGKKTVAIELDREAQRRGLKSVFVPTGQTGVAIAGWGIAVDAVVADFIAGAAERLVVEGAKRGGELLFVEGQGSLSHPAYSGVTLGLMHGSAPHAYVLCHVAGATEIEGYPGYPIQPLAELIELHERASLPLRPARVAAIALNTRALNDDDARAAARSVTRGNRASGRRPGAVRRRQGPGRRPGGPAILRGEGLMKDRLNTAVRLTLACACAALVFAPAAGADLMVGVADDQPKTSPAIAEQFYDAMNDVGLTEDRITILWDSRAPTTIRDRDQIAHAVNGRGGARRPRHALDLPGPGARDHGFAAGRRRVRRLHRARRAGVPAGEGLHRRQRAEQGALLAAAVQRESHRGRLRRLRAAPRRVLRCAQGGRLEHHGHRRRPGPARKRQSVRRGQPLDLPAALHPRHGPRLPREQAEAADHGRAQLPCAPERRHGPARDRATPGRTRASRTSRASSRLSGMRSSARRSRPSRRRECLAGRCGR